MIKNLLKIAKELDENGFTKEADIVDLIIKRVAAEDLGTEDENVGDISEEDFRALLSESPLKSFED